MRRRSSHHEHSQRAGVAEIPVGTLDGKWIAEGKGKGRGSLHRRERAEYLDREPALEAGRVIARRRGIRSRESIKGGTADLLRPVL